MPGESKNRYDVNDEISTKLGCHSRVKVQHITSATPFARIFWDAVEGYKIRSLFLSYLVVPNRIPERLPHTHYFQLMWQTTLSDPLVSFNYCTGLACNLFPIETMEDP